jgi:hypothetical protein
MRAYLQGFAVSVLLLTANLAVAEQTVSLTVGGKSIKVAVPDGYVRSSETVPMLYDITAAAIPTGNRLVEFFIANADAKQILLGTTKGLKQTNFQVQAMRQIEAIDLSPQDWTQFRPDLVRGLGGADADTLIKADHEKSNERISETAGTAVEVKYGKIGKPSLYGDDQESVRFTMLVPISVKTASGEVQTVVACAGAIVVVSSRLIYIFAYGDPEAEGGMPAVRAALDQFVEQTRAIQ